MKTLWISFLMLTLLTSALDGYGKTRIIKGTVYTKDGKEARGVIVTADKSKSKYYTSFDGTYEIKAKTNSKWLKFNFREIEAKLGIDTIQRDVINSDCQLRRKKLIWYFSRETSVNTEINWFLL